MIEDTNNMSNEEFLSLISSEKVFSEEEINKLNNYHNNLLNKINNGDTDIEETLNKIDSLLENMQINGSIHYNEVSKMYNELKETYDKKYGIEKGKPYVLERKNNNNGLMNAVILVLGIGIIVSMLLFIAVTLITR